MIKVIARKNTPTGLPIFTTVVIYLMLDKFHAAPWVWGAVGTLLIIIWIAAIIRICTEKSVDIFKDSK